MSALPDNLREELDGWGFRSQRLRDGRFVVSDDGSKLSYVDDYDGEEYVLAESGYDREELGDTPRPFLATVIDVLRWAMTNPEPHVSEEANHG